ncbi:RICIN domain-containing protein [Paenibacillus hexagrammi]|uniref:RICIN domain-containing protein n=1 Tax=Paenibacillus hexagrammi TaxID=2908839 RepID=A0ABY3SHW9_9BACL|nr:RICIN domain-containing protein [Paenibacillus sp. YPD9-1]UJF32829.1 RICIN domain-containing protein [Paenibacillus sp. YPD9-1]
MMKLRKKWMPLLLATLLTLSLVMLSTLSLGKPQTAEAATSAFKGVNWADSRDNFVNGVLYVSGLSSSDTYASASTVADKVVGQFVSTLGANTIRMPINEPTVSSYWGTYTGAIDKALTKGNVILAYWAYSSGKPANMTDFWNMWTTVVNKYGSNANVYFEVINEPYGYSNTDLNNMYNDWLTTYSTIPKGRIILDGAGYAQNVSVPGGDSRLNDTLLAVHDYSFFVGTPYMSEAQWADHLKGYVGSYASRTIMTEWGSMMQAGYSSRYNTTYPLQDYNTPGGSLWVAYVRGISSQLREWGMGSVYWPGLRDGDGYSMTTKSGSGSGISLTVNNPSGLTRLQYAWGMGSDDPAVIYVKIKNVTAGLYIDGMGRTTNGSATGQYSASSSTNQQWALEPSGYNYKLKNRATGLYLDGMGRTANGSDAGQYSSSSSSNQIWQLVSSGANVRFKNAATGLYLDGMGRTASGSNLGQYASSGSSNQQWQIVSP